MKQKKMAIAVLLTTLTLIFAFVFQNCSKVGFSKIQEQTLSSIAACEPDQFQAENDATCRASFMKISINEASTVSAALGSLYIVSLEKSPNVIFDSSFLEILSGNCLAKSTWQFPLDSWKLNGKAVKLGLNNWNYTLTDQQAMGGCQWSAVVRGHIQATGKPIESEVVINTTHLSPGVCGPTNNSCSSGSLTDSADSATQFLWICNGSNGGANSSCSLNKPPAPLNGVCGASTNTCNAGTFSDTADTGTQFLWACLGANGGSNSNCSVNKPPPPVNGVCGGATNTCNVGTLVDTADNSQKFLWQCNGANGGSNASCSFDKVCYDVVSELHQNCVTSLTWQIRQCGGAQENGTWTFSPGNNPYCFEPMQYEGCTYFQCRAATVPTCTTTRTVVVPCPAD